MGLLDFWKRLVKHRNETENEISFQNPSEALPTESLEECVAVNEPKQTPVERGYVRATCLEMDGMVFNELNQGYIAFDVETTGLSACSDRIVELGAVRFINGVAEEAFSTLVNPGIPIPPCATAINHITNDMLATAPSEKEAYTQLLAFLGDAIHAKTILCAYNAQFDIDFLSEALIRLGFHANIRYVDTLRLSRKYIKGLPNYKQITVADCLGIRTQAAHRAADDAQVCGEILQYILGEVNREQEAQRRQMEKERPTSEELEVCAYIQNVIVQHGEDSQFIRFRRNSGNYVEASCLYPFLKFKLARKGKYVIIPKEVKAQGLSIEACTVSEGGTNNVRAYFSSPFDLQSLDGHIFTSYKAAQKSLIHCIHNSSRDRAEAMRIIGRQKALLAEDVKELLERAKQRKQDVQTTMAAEQIAAGDSIITRESVVINPVHNRVPLEQIKNLGDWEKGYDQGSPYYNAGEELRKAGNLNEAIRLFDLARYYGYNAPALYEAYVKAYRKLKDYENEIELCEEGMERLSPEQAGVLEARRDKAIQLLYARQISQRNRQQEAAEK